MLMSAPPCLICSRIPCNCSFSLCASSVMEVLASLIALAKAFSLLSKLALRVCSLFLKSISKVPNSSLLCAIFSCNSCKDCVKASWLVVRFSSSSSVLRSAFLYSFFSLMKLSKLSLNSSVVFCIASFSCVTSALKSCIVFIASFASLLNSSLSVLKSSRLPFATFSKSSACCRSSFWDSSPFSYFPTSSKKV